jgi:hypothetical protein
MLLLILLYLVHVYWIVVVAVVACLNYANWSLTWAWVLLVAGSLFAHRILEIMQFIHLGLIRFLKYFITQFRAIIMRCTLVNPNPVRVIPVPFLYYVLFMPHDRHILFIWSFLFGFYWRLFEVGIYCGSSLWRVGSDGNGSNQDYEGGFFDNNEGMPSHHIYPSFTTCMIFYVLQIYAILFQ